MDSFFQVTTRTRICDFTFERPRAIQVFWLSNISATPTSSSSPSTFSMAPEKIHGCPRSTGASRPFFKKIRCIGVKDSKRLSDKRRDSGRPVWLLPWGLRQVRVGLWLFVSNKDAAFTAAFFYQANFADRHFAVDGFAHVVNRQPSHAYCRHRLHFDAGLAVDADRGFNFDTSWVFLRV